MLFVGRTTIEIIRSWILMHISSRINISLVSDFFVKLMKLPISFFDVKMTGDIMQRINDHHRIENFLTSTSLNVLFSFVNLIVFSLNSYYYIIPDPIHVAKNFYSVRHRRRWTNQLRLSSPTL